MHKQWKFKPVDQEAVASLQKQLNIHEVLCRLLVQRGIGDFEQARAFFRPHAGQLHDPFLMKGMEPAVQRLLHAIEANEQVMIYGDYDVDGTTAVAVVFSFLKRNFPSLSLAYYIPHRYREGYGISFQGIDHAKATGVTLLIALDCGIKSIEKIAYAKQQGIDVIVCDHHMPGDKLPDALAILNPKQKGCPYPYKELSGCGIGFKLITALANQQQLAPEAATRYLDLVATSIAADIVPVSGENRTLCFLGLQKANQHPCRALHTLKNILSLQGELTISDLVFSVAPRINAAGRMDDAQKAVAFFIEEEPEKAKTLALALHMDNEKRKDTDKKITEEALKIIEAENRLYPAATTVVFQPHWHKGVVGIVASRLMEHHYRPTIVLTRSDGRITGSARSVSGFNIYEALSACADLLENFGGHFFAAGMTLLPENLTAFKERFERVVAKTLLPASREPTIHIDAELKLNVIQPGFYNILRQFSPFGPENLQPVFYTRQLFNWNNHSRIVGANHLKLGIVEKENDRPMFGIGFGMGDQLDIVNSGCPFDLLYTIEENHWNGRKSLQLKVIDIRPSAGDTSTDPVDDN